MQTPYTASREPETRDLSSSLVERIDPAIGEATSVMGAVMTEVLRRSLRGGVMKIGTELQEFVAEKVDATIAERKPALEAAVSAAAAESARGVAATVAGEEVRGLERWAKEWERTQRLARSGRPNLDSLNDVQRSTIAAIEDFRKLVN